jgi:ABC-type glutathione transport system ATPase component
MSAPLVEIRDLHVEATTDSGRRIEIIKGVSFDIAAGEIVALIGESGSGKTTIALTLMGHARAGARIAGGRVRDRRPRHRRDARERTCGRCAASTVSPMCRRARRPPSIRRTASSIR